MKVIKTIDKLLRPSQEQQNDEPFTFDIRKKHSFLMEGFKTGDRTKTGFEATWSPKYNSFKVTLIGHVSVHPSIKVDDQMPNGKPGNFKRRICYMNDEQLAGFVRYNFSDRLTEFEGLSIEY